MNILEIKNLCKSFGKTPVLRDISFSIKQGEIIAVLGESGCGKSTLLGTIAGFFGIDGGEIWIEGEKVADSAFFTPPKARSVGILFQDYALFPHFTARQNILFGIENLPKDEQNTRYESLISTLGLQNLGARYPNELSGGQQQRVALARTLAPAPKIILFDEPFSNLNHTMSVQMRYDIKQILRARGQSAILVTHHKEDAFYLADKIILIDKGEIIDAGAPKEIYNHPKTTRSAEFLGAVNVVSESEIERIQNPAFKAWIEAKRGLIRPKDLKIIDAESSSQISLPPRQIYAEVLENIFYGDYYEIIVRVENLRLSLHQDSAIEASNIVLKFG